MNSLRDVKDLAPYTPTPLLTKRELSHELSNALEIIVQTSFLLGTLDLGENGRAWHKMLDDGVQGATAINKQLRDRLRSDPPDEPSSRR